MTTFFDPVATIPVGLSLGRHATNEQLPGTEPIPYPPATTTEAAIAKPVPVKAAEVCGPCGSTLSLEWSGRTDALSVLREWREGHRCQPEPAATPDGAGSKGALIERPGYAPGFIPE